MFILKGAANGRRFVLLGLTGEQLSGILGSGMLATLDGVLAAPLSQTFDGADYVSIVRADSIMELRVKALEAGLTIVDAGGARPGIIQRPS